MGILGTLIGGYIMKKYNFDIRNTLKFVMAMASIGCLMITFLFACGCESQKIAGLTVPYRFAETKIAVTYRNYGTKTGEGEKI